MQLGFGRTYYIYMCVYIYAMRIYKCAKNAHIYYIYKYKRGILYTLTHTHKTHQDGGVPFDPLPTGPWRVIATVYTVVLQFEIILYTFKLYTHDTTRPHGNGLKLYIYSIYMYSSTGAEEEIR